MSYQPEQQKQQQQLQTMAAQSGGGGGDRNSKADYPAHSQSQHNPYMAMLNMPMDRNDVPSTIAQGNLFNHPSSHPSSSSSNAMRLQFINQMGVEVPTRHQQQQQQTNSNSSTISSPHMTSTIPATGRLGDFVQFTGQSNHHGSSTAMNITNPNLHSNFLHRLSNSSNHQQQQQQQQQQHVSTFEALQVMPTFNIDQAFSAWGSRAARPEPRGRSISDQHPPHPDTTTMPTVQSSHEVNFPNMNLMNDGETAQNNVNIMNIMSIGGTAAADNYNQQVQQQQQQQQTLGWLLQGAGGSSDLQQHASPTGNVTTIVVGNNIKKEDKSAGASAGSVQKPTQKKTRAPSTRKKTEKSSTATTGAASQRKGNNATGGENNGGVVKVTRNISASEVVFLTEAIMFPKSSVLYVFDVKDWSNKMSFYERMSYSFGVPSTQKPVFCNYLDSKVMHYERTCQGVYFCPEREEWQNGTAHQDRAEEDFSNCTVKPCRYRFHTCKQHQHALKRSPACKFKLHFYVPMDKEDDRRLLLCCGSHSHVLLIDDPNRMDTVVGAPSSLASANATARSNNPPSATPTPPPVSSPATTTSSADQSPISTASSGGSLFVEEQNTTKGSSTAKGAKSSSSTRKSSDNANRSKRSKSTISHSVITEDQIDQNLGAEDNNVDDDAYYAYDTERKQQQRATKLQHRQSGKNQTYQLQQATGQLSDRIEIVATPVLPQEPVPEQSSPMIIATSPTQSMVAMAAMQQQQQQQQPHMHQMLPPHSYSFHNRNDSLSALSHHNENSSHGLHIAIQRNRKSSLINQHTPSPDLLSGFSLTPHDRFAFGGQAALPGSSNSSPGNPVFFGQAGNHFASNFSSSRDFDFSSGAFLPNNTSTTPNSNRGFFNFHNSNTGGMWGSNTSLGFQSQEQPSLLGSVSVVSSGSASTPSSNGSGNSASTPTLARDFTFSPGSSLLHGGHVQTSPHRRELSTSANDLLGAQWRHHDEHSLLNTDKSFSVSAFFSSQNSLSANNHPSGNGGNNDSGKSLHISSPNLTNQRPGHAVHSASGSGSGQRTTNAIQSFTNEHVQKFVDSDATVLNNNVFSVRDGNSGSGNNGNLQTGLERAREQGPAMDTSSPTHGPLVSLDGTSLLGHTSDASHHSFNSSGLQGLQGFLQAGPIDFAGPYIESQGCMHSNTSVHMPNSTTGSDVSDGNGKNHCAPGSTYSPRLGMSSPSTHAGFLPSIKYVTGQLRVDREQHPSPRNVQHHPSSCKDTKLS